MGHIVLTANTAWYIANFRSNLIGRLQENGHQITVLAPQSDSFEQLRALGCNVVDIKMDNKGTNPIADGRLFLTFLRHLRHLEPDAVLSFTVKNNIYGALAARKLGIPILPNVSGLGTAFVQENWLTRVVVWLSRQAFSRLPVVFFQNEEDRDQFIERGIVRRERTYRLPGSGVDLEHFSATEFPTGSETVFILIGRLLWDKGVGEFVEAARRLRARGLAVRCQILGFLDVQNTGAIDRATMDAWVSEGVIEYVGSTKDVRPNIAAAHCVVLPTNYREGVPRSLLEGGAMGRPLITTDAPGCRDTVEDGKTGFLVARRDADSVASAMSRIAEMDKSVLINMGIASRDKMVAEFDERFVLAAYESWLETL